ncbi:UNVERIFIED_CONTAM: hypothetical protein Sradi_2563800 [Sesamum radiatum]|uniref:Retrotransposon gag domain-containing protein n=1 Tax=Sesamum radiatum TaxID=300843 RepID=A0AAW2S402_SESRA
MPVPPLAMAPPRRSPFAPHILAEAIQPGIKIPSLNEYNGGGDPQDHLDRFSARADLLDISDAAYCKLFRTTLSGKAMAWFNQLPPGTIESFEQLAQRFLHHFAINKRYPKTASYLFTIIQRENESLREYVQRFSEAVLEVPHVNPELLASIMQQNLKRGRFKESIAGKPPATQEELLMRAEKYIRIEESTGSRPITPLKRRMNDDERIAPARIEGNKRERRQSDLTQYTPLNAPRVEILSVAKQQGLVRWPFPLKDNPKRMTSDKICHFHRDRGHSTEECYHLKNEIEKLIRRGYLREFVDRGKGKAHEPMVEPRRDAPRIESGERRGEEQVKKENLPTAGIIGVISGGPASGDSTRARKAAVREAINMTNAVNHVAYSEVAATQHENPEGKITFSDQDLGGHPPTNNDAIVISATVSNFWVKKILIDSGSSADILFHGAFAQMGIGSSKLIPVNTPLTSFSGDIVEPLGEISLPVSLGTYPQRATKFIKFLVVDSPSAYNMILGRPSLNMFRAVASTYHLKIKFPTPDGVGEEIGDRRQARECYANTLKNPGNTPRLKAEKQKRMPQTTPGKHQEQTPHRESTTKSPEENKRRKIEQERMEAIEEVKMIEFFGDHRRP